MRRVYALLLTLTLALTACAAPSGGSGTGVAPPQPGQSTPAQDRPTQDPSGAQIALPEQIDTLVVLAPSIAEQVIALGDGEKIVAIDTQTQAQGYEGLGADLPAFDLMAPDAEQLAALAPDVVLVSGLSAANGMDPFQPLRALGICVVCIPTSQSIQGIYDDMTFLGQMLGRQGEAQAINVEMKAHIEQVAEVGASIPQVQRHTVYFEIAPAPYAYSFGGGVYLDEMIALIGAKNIFADQTGWFSVEGESALARNPDVILTNVNYIEDPVGEILARPGWAAVEAVAQDQVYQIDNLSSSLANQNVVKALDEMAKAVYPDYFG